MVVDRSCRPTRFGNIDLQIALSTPPVEVHASVRPCGRAMIFFFFFFLFLMTAIAGLPRPRRAPPHL